MTQPTQQTDPFIELAFDLRVIAERIDSLAGSGLPAPAAVGIDIQPVPDDDQDDQTRMVDAMGEAIFGTPGETRLMVGGVYHHTATGRIGRVRVSAFCAVKQPDERDQEIARLRAELAAARGEVDPSPAAAAAEVPADLALPRNPQGGLDLAALDAQVGLAPMTGAEALDAAATPPASVDLMARLRASLESARAERLARAARDEDDREDGAR